MEASDNFQFLSAAIQVVYVDLLLSGDNALVIALASRALPAPLRRRAMVFGTAAAVLLRIFLAATITLVLMVPFLRLAGAALLLAVGINLIGRQAEGGEQPSSDDRATDLLSAIRTIAIADASMSLDNMLAITGVAHGNFYVLAIGLIFSVPPLFLGSMAINALLDRYPALLTAGAALLGWIAGGLAVTDPAIADWVRTDAASLTVFAPPMFAIYVPLQGRIARRSRILERAKEANIPAGESDPAGAAARERKKSDGWISRSLRGSESESRATMIRFAKEIAAFGLVGALAGGGRLPSVFCALTFAAALFHVFVAIRRWEPFRRRPLAHWHEALAFFCLSLAVYGLAFS